MDELKKELLSLIRDMPHTRDELYDAADLAINKEDVARALRALVEENQIVRDDAGVYHLWNAAAAALTPSNVTSDGRSDTAPAPSLDDVHQHEVSRVNVRPVVADEPTAAERVIEAMRQIGKPVTRGEIEAYTGMPQKTVQGTTLRLRARGLVEIVGTSGKMKLFALAGGAPMPPAPAPKPGDKPPVPGNEEPLRCDGDVRLTVDQSIDRSRLIALRSRLVAQCDEARSTLNTYIDLIDDAVLSQLVESSVASADALARFDEHFRGIQS